MNYILFTVCNTIVSVASSSSLTVHSVINDTVKWFNRVVTYTHTPDLLLLLCFIAKSLYSHHYRFQSAPFPSDAVTLRHLLI